MAGGAVQHSPIGMVEVLDWTRTVANMDRTTILIHGDEPFRWDNSITPSIAQGLNWEAGSAAEFSAAAEDPLHPFLYTRHGNANHVQVAGLVARLEGAERAMVTASGMGALTTLMLTLVKAGDHVIGQRSMYAGAGDMMLRLLPRLGVECTMVDQTDLGAFEAALRPNTTVVLLETPSNPRLEVTDLRAVARLARAHGAVTVADNTFATPINQRPLELGIDVVWHSATKYMGGHSDLMAGVIAADSATIERVWQTANVVGAVCAPFNAWLLLRGLRTLDVRMHRHNANGLALATALDEHPAVARVHYAGLPGHPGHDVAASQMSGYGGVLSLELAGGYAAADAFIDALVYPRRTSSLGDVSSLVVHPASLWAKNLTPAELEEAGVAPGLVRFSAGIENTADLVEDALRAAERAGR